MANELQYTLSAVAGRLTGIIAYAPEGIERVSDENIQLSSGNSLSLTREQQTDISTLNHITLASIKAVSIFTHKADMKLFTRQGKVEVQAQNDALNITPKQDIKTDTAGIELGRSRNVTIKAATLQKMDLVKMNASRNLPDAVNRKRTIKEQVQQRAVLKLNEI